VKFFVRGIACLSVFAAMLFAVSAARADGHTFKVCVRHNINGRSLGLSKELPVIAEVTPSGGETVKIPLEFKDTFCAELPAGEYLIRVFSVELNDYIGSMTVGPVEIPPGADLFILARLSGGKTPILDVKD
jgi:hypothetical protein